MGPAQLPPPALVDSVVYASPPANWWVEVRVIDAPTHGLGNITPFSFPWPSPDRARELSEGEMWTTLLAVDWKGEPLLLEPSTESSNARTPVILSEYRKLKFPPLAEGSPLRWWKLEARLVNRPLPRPPSE